MGAKIINYFYFALISVIQMLGKLVNSPIGVVGFDLGGVVVETYHIGDAEAVGAARLVVHRVLA